MALHPQAEQVLAILDSFGDAPIEERTPSAVRETIRARQLPPTVDIHEIRPVDCSGVAGRLYRPSDHSPLGLLVYFHGGGWVICDLDTHDDLARRLAVESGCAVLSVDYRLAPEHPFPAGLDDALAATRWAHAHAHELGCNEGRIAIGGDSAGANLAAVVAQNTDVPLRFLLMIYPTTDARGGTKSHEECSEGPFLTTAGMQWFLDHYLSGGDGAPEDPRVSPALADDAALARSPATLVITAEHDPLRDEGEAYAVRLQEVGVPASFSRYDGMFHAFMSFAEFLDDGRRALAEAGGALRSALAD